MKLADRFQSPILCILSILVGLPLGWWLRDSQGKFDHSKMPSKRTEQSFDHATVLETTAPFIDEKKITHQKIRSEFIQTLNSEQFDDAIITYQHHEQFQSDIGLLSELAASYISTNQLAKALEVYASARSYSYTREEIRSFDEQIHQIAHALFEKNRGLPSLENLIPTFLKLSYLEPDYSFYRLVLAESYLMLNDAESAIRELQILQMDEENNEKASQLLSRLLPEPTDKELINEKTIVPLSGAGAHLIVDTIAGNKLNARLLIDTGASLTTLPHHILDTLQQKKQASQIGHIDLTTARGIHRAPLYRIDQFKIGDFLVSNLEAAEFGPIDRDVDGLLGMNVLNQFNFFIDQNLHQLSLTPRRME